MTRRPHRSDAVYVLLVAGIAFAVIVAGFASAAAITMVLIGGAL